MTFVNTAKHVGDQNNSFAKWDIVFGMPPSIHNHVAINRWHFRPLFLKIPNIWLINIYGELCFNCALCWMLAHTEYMVRILPWKNHEFVICSTVFISRSLCYVQCNLYVMFIALIGWTWMFICNNWWHVSCLHTINRLVYFVGVCLNCEWHIELINNSLEIL